MAHNQLQCYQQFYYRIKIFVKLNERRFYARGQIDSDGISEKGVKGSRDQ